MFCDDQRAPPQDGSPLRTRFRRACKHARIPDKPERDRGCGQERAATTPVQIRSPRMALRGCLQQQRCAGLPPPASRDLNRFRQLRECRESGASTAPRIKQMISRQTLEHVTRKFVIEKMRCGFIGIFWSPQTISFTNADFRRGNLRRSQKSAQSSPHDFASEKLFQGAWAIGCSHSTFRVNICAFGSAQPIQHEELEASS